jgi:hypothetical protein
MYEAAARMQRHLLGSERTGNACRILFAVRHGMSVTCYGLPAHLVTPLRKHTLVSLRYKCGRAFRCRMHLCYVFEGVCFVCSFSQVVVCCTHICWIITWRVLSVRVPHNIVAVFQQRLCCVYILVLDIICVSIVICVFLYELIVFPWCVRIR